MSSVKEIISDFEPALSGLLGGAVRVFLGEEKNFWKAVTVMFASAVCAHFLTPLVAELVESWIDVDAQASLGFVVGYSALIIMHRIESFVGGTAIGKLFKK